MEPSWPGGWPYTSDPPASTSWVLPVLKNLNFFSIFPRTRSSTAAPVNYFWARWAHLGVKRNTLLPQRWEFKLGLWLMLCKPLLGELHPKTLTLFTQRKNVRENSLEPGNKKKISTYSFNNPRDFSKQDTLSERLYNLNHVLEGEN